MLVGDYVQDFEAMVPFQTLQLIGHAIHAVCPDKKAGEFVRTTIHDFEGDQTYSKKRGHNFTLNATFSKINADDYDALVIPGGRAPENVIEPSGTVNGAPLLRRKKAHCRNMPRRTGTVGGWCALWKILFSYPAVSSDIVCAGGKWVEISLDKVSVDGNLVNAPAWLAHHDWLAKFTELLGTKMETYLSIFLGD